MTARRAACSAPTNVCGRSYAFDPKAHGLTLQLRQTSCPACGSPLVAVRGALAEELPDLIDEHRKLDAQIAESIRRRQGESR